MEELEQHDILGYITFSSTEEFENWQLKNIGVKMQQIQPMSLGMDGVTQDSPGYKQETDMTASMGLFVLYWK
jgi:hypothetical protein